MRIKYIIPFPFDEEGIALRAAQFPPELRTPGVEYDFVGVKNSALGADSYYEMALLDMYVAEAGLASEDEGYDAVVIDTVSDSGMDTLRSRLTIPVVGPGVVQQHVAAMLGRTFSILTLWRRSVSSSKTMQAYGTAQYCVSVRSIDIQPDQKLLLTGREEETFAALEAEGRKAVEEDGAHVILLGSTTMYQAVPHLRRTLGVPVLNPGPLAIKLAELFVQLGLSHSKVAYRSPGVVQDEKFHSLVAADVLR
jgi:allantoin racemase